MKALEFTNDKLIEAVMNPNEYSKAIATGHDQGVLVGFEFEVCMPETQFRAEDNQVDINKKGLLEGIDIQHIT